MLYINRALNRVYIRDSTVKTDSVCNVKLISEDPRALLSASQPFQLPYVSQPKDAPGRVF